MSGPIAASVGPQGATFNATGKRTIYAFDLKGNGTYITNKRPVYLAQEWVPDGLKVARNGYIVTGTGKGVDVLDQEGALLVRIQTNYTVQNFAWTGKDYRTFWLMGQGGISKVEWDLQGQDRKSNVAGMGGSPKPSLGPICRARWTRSVRSPSKITDTQPL